jgi:hypothetical protein
MDANESIDAWMATALLPVAVLAGALLAASLLVTVTEALTVRLAGAAPWSWSPAPRAFRRAAFAACGLSLVVAVPGASGATPGHRPEPRPGSACASPCSSLDGLRLPDLPVSELPLSDQRGEAAARSSIVVRRGDCLWSRTADLLGAAADPSDVAAAAHALYRGNRQGIGPDPNLIFPGTHLTLPEVLR